MIIAAHVPIKTPESMTVTFRKHVPLHFIEMIRAAGMRKTENQHKATENLTRSGLFKANKIKGNIQPTARIDATSLVFHATL